MKSFTCPFRWRRCLLLMKDWLATKYKYGTATQFGSPAASASLPTKTIKHLQTWWNSDAHIPTCAQRAWATVQWKAPIGATTICGATDRHWMGAGLPVA
ncbi:uncharacterized protein YALI1_C02291g [Yarrowia lipolytica]|uniref:Uncharacterized protein n=1 Tax=Yarrowia lipolytica TaxID=4952 RepID=A0A1D8N992_YARLL|nr:hypothetical protein YALI1_C02291g [Yarrowia lipolytica]